MFNLFLFFKIHMPLFHPLIRYGKNKTRRDVLFYNRFIRGYIFLIWIIWWTVFSQISYLQAYVFLYPKQGLNIYLFVFYFNGPLGMSSFQNHNYSSEQSKLAYHKKHIDLQMKQSSASFFSFFSFFSSTFNYKFYNICKTSHDLYLSL